MCVSRTIRRNAPLPRRRRGRERGKPGAGCSADMNYSPFRYPLIVPRGSQLSLGGFLGLCCCRFGLSPGFGRIVGLAGLRVQVRESLPEVCLQAQELGLAGGGLLTAGLLQCGAEVALEAPAP